MPLNPVRKVSMHGFHNNDALVKVANAITKLKGVETRCSYSWGSDGARFSRVPNIDNGNITHAHVYPYLGFVLVPAMRTTIGVCADAFVLVIAFRTLCLISFSVFCQFKKRPSPRAFYPLANMSFVVRLRN